MSKNNLAENLKFLRKKAKISQQKLADELGLTRSNIASYESGRAEPKASFLTRLALFFKVDLITLIDGDAVQASPSSTPAKKQLDDENHIYSESARKNHNGHHSNGSPNGRKPFIEYSSVSVLTTNKSGNGMTLEKMVLQCDALKKMLEGFREFHKFRASDVRNTEKVNQGVYNDYENLLRVMETMLTQHEGILQYIQKVQHD